MRMTVVAEPDNRRNKDGHDSDFCKGSHDASILCFWMCKFTALLIAPVWSLPSVQAGPRHLFLVRIRNAT